MDKITLLGELTEETLPEELKISRYFDITSHQSDFRDLFEEDNVRSVLDLLIRLEGYLAKKLEKKVHSLSAMKEVTPPATAIVTGKVRVYAEGAVEFFPAVLTGPCEGEGIIFLGKNTVIIGSSLLAASGHIAIGEDTLLGPGSTITGPSWIGPGNEIRPGCYFREQVLTGRHCVFRCEAKHALFLDGAEFPHPSYVGDSIMGYKSHFGNQATTANITLANASRGEDKWKPVILPVGSRLINTGLNKLGVIMGDNCQTGCSTVFDPGVFLGHSTWVYPLLRILGGFYGPSATLKSRPGQAGIVKIMHKR